MPSVTRLVVLRHGETEWNAQRRLQGHTDIALNAHGQQQATLLAKALTDDALNAVYSSDLQRAHQTAMAVAQPHGLTVHALPALRERCFGNVEGSSFIEFEQQHPVEAEHWRKRTPHWKPPGGGESLEEVRDRIVHTVCTLASQHTGQHIAIVVHGGVLDVLYRAATGLDLQAPRTWDLPNCAINRLLWTPQGLTLVGWGDTQHLEGMHAAHDISVR